MKYAILGGTFNPIHVGHSIMAEFVYSTGQYDGVIIIPSSDPPHKSDEVINGKHRMNMCELVANRQRYIDVSNIEIDREGITYTIDTLEALKKKGEHEYVMIIGSDTLMTLESWYRYKNVFELCEFLVIDRISQDDKTIVEQINRLEKSYGAKFNRVKMPYIGISSTLIRERRKNQQSITHLVDRSVESYIHDHELYQLKDDLDKGLKKRISSSLKKQMSEKRFEHTMGVKKVAMSLADTYEADIDQAALAGMLHDCAKHLKIKEIFEHCDKYHIKLSEIEKKNPQVIHAKLGAVIASDEYEIYDQDVLNAIEFHTTGRADMSLLEQIVFVADYIEPNRTKASYLGKYRQLAYESLDDVTYFILRDTLEHLNNRDIVELNPMTIEAYNFYKELFEIKQEKR